MTRPFQKLSTLLALIGIFACGGVTGWFAHRAGQNQATAATPSTDQAAGSSWTDRAMLTLTRELQLTPEQTASIRPLLTEAAGRMDLDKERALFQLHMQVLKAHDEMRPLLRPDQVPALERMRERLKSDIKQRFSAFLKDPTQPGPDL
jgi:hypothetical protein